ncbi:MAG: DUF362 domain-containing protein [Lachnospiraceae bacterium]|nr:DUF362 domain-containing protein [Lachnospiraceae bacterium]
MDRQDILMIHGTDYKEMTKKLLEAADLETLIGNKRAQVALKPNLVTSNPPSSGATTHPELLSGAIEYLKEHGFSNIVIMEGSWVGCGTGSAFRIAGYDRVCRDYNVPFIDLQKDSSTSYDAKGMKIAVCDKAMAADFMINMPVLKGHGQTLVTCALKNNKGIIPNSEKRRFHTLGLHKPIAHLNTVAPNSFILVDNICGDLDFEEGGNPVVMNRILGALDPVLCDAFVCESMGIPVEDVPYIGMAERLGVGCADPSKARLIRINEPQEGAEKKMRVTGRAKRLAAYTAPIDACSACYGSLLHALARLDEEGQLRKNLPPVAIGQGYKEKSGDIGIGKCTGCFAKSLGGCPPTAAKILDFLRENWI